MSKEDFIDSDGNEIHPVTVFVYPNGELVPAAKLTRGQEVPEGVLEKLNAAGGICGPGPKFPGDGDYIMWGPGTPNYDPRTDSGVN